VDGAALSDRQLAVLRWVADGCPSGVWPDETHKLTARALKNRGLVEISRPDRKWFATLTDAGRTSLETGQFPPKRRYDQQPRPRPRPRWDDEDDQPVDATVRAMREIKRRRTPTRIAQKQREIREVYMRFKVVVTRVQVAERFVRASDEEAAAGKVQEEFERPYGFFGSWKTTGSEIDVIEAEQTTVIGPASLSDGGPMLLSVKESGKALGISTGAIYELINQGDIEHVAIGSRKYISREALKEFIQQNTHRGYYRAR
jgi:excisionase family DNA binding protein